MRSNSSSRTPFIVTLLALLLPLLVACGGGTPTSGPTSGGPAVAEAPKGSENAPIGAAATAAPAAESAAGAPRGDASSARISAPTAAAAAPAAGEVGLRPTQPPGPVQPQQQFSPLKAGEVDDNQDFPAYLDYLQTYSGLPAHQIDVSERYVLNVLNDQQQPVLDARVRLMDGDQQVFEGRTYAGGKTIVFPRALGISENTQSLRVLIDKGNSTVEGTLTRGQDNTQSFLLHDAAALPTTPKLDVLFLLDATGSMGDEIARIQQTIVSIADRIDGFAPRPELRFGLVSYRDRGDDYVTRVNDFTGDVGAFRDVLMNTQAGGGGDEPESLNEGLHAAVQRVTWAEDAVRLVFLVADAPPHLDYQQDYDYLAEARTAVAKGVKIYPIAASNTDDQAAYIFRQLAQQTLGRFIFLTYQPGQNGGAPGETTTLDVNPQAFSVERLDDLVVQVVQRELAQAQGAA